MTGAVKKCRNDKGPVFIECLTHRLRGHYEGDPAKYRELSQLLEWKKQDPIVRVERVLRKKKLATSRDLEAIEAEARTLVEKAAEFALTSPLPAAEEIVRDVMA
jgi:pyruvate dehydrogenase E1 component alpha subunit